MRGRRLCPPRAGLGTPTTPTHAARSLTPTSSRRWWLLWVALAAFVAVRATWRPDHRGVLLDHLEFGRRLLHGTDVYADWKSDPDAPVRPLHAPYPPSFGLLTAPFAMVADAAGLRPARLAWSLLQITAIAALGLAMRRMVRTEEPLPAPTARDRWRWLVTLLLMTRFVLRDTHGGGGNLINVALCALAFVAAERGQDRRAGWLLGVSLATKPTQIWLLPVFLAMGHRRAALHAGIAGAASILVSAALLHFDPAPWHRWLAGSLALGAQTDAFAAPAFDFPKFEWMNQSLRCATARWFGTVPPEIAARVTFGVMPGLGWSPAAAAWVARSTTAVAGIGVLVSAWQRRRSSSSDRVDRAFVFAAALTLSLLASPLSWKPHHVALLPIVYLMLERAEAQRSRALWAMLAAFVLSCGIGQQLLGDDGDEFLNSTYVLPAFDLLLLATALTLRRKPPN